MSFECFPVTAVTTIPSVPQNTTQSAPLELPLLLAFHNCSMTIAGSTYPLDVTTGTGHTIAFNQDHSVDINIAGGQIDLYNPVWQCSEIVGATQLRTGVVGSLAAVSGLTVTGQPIPIMTDECGFGVTYALSTVPGSPFTISTNVGTMSTPVAGSATSLSITDLP